MSTRVNGYDPNESGRKLVHYCPGCGMAETFSEESFRALDNSDKPLNPVFDLWCTSCGWSGDISPDIAITMTSEGH